MNCYWHLLMMTSVKERCCSSRNHCSSSLQGVIRTYNIITSGVYNAATYFVKFYVGFYLSFTMYFIWSLYIAATVRIKAVQELQQQHLM